MSRPASQDQAVSRTLQLGALEVPLDALMPAWRVAVPLGSFMVLVGLYLTAQIWSAGARGEIADVQARIEQARSTAGQLELELEIRRGSDELQRAARLYGLVPPHRAVEGSAP